MFPNVLVGSVTVGTGASHVGADIVALCIVFAHALPAAAVLALIRGSTRPVGDEHERGAQKHAGWRRCNQ